jgi:hypothetical protein
MSSSLTVLTLFLTLMVAFAAKSSSTAGAHPARQATYDEAVSAFYKLVNNEYFPSCFRPGTSLNKKHFNILASHCQGCVSNPGNVGKVSAFKRYEELEKRFLLQPDPDSLVTIFNQVIEGKSCSAYFYFHNGLLTWFAEIEKEVLFGVAPNVSAIMQPESGKIREIAWQILHQSNFVSQFLRLRPCDEIPGQKLLDALLLATGAHHHEAFSVEKAIYNEYEDIAVCVKQKDHEWFVHIGVKDGLCFNTQRTPKWQTFELIH